jgi:hypothetical protein
MRQSHFRLIRLVFTPGFITLQTLLLLVFCSLFSSAQTVDGEHQIGFYDRWGTGYTAAQLNASTDSSLYSSVYSVGAFELHYNAMDFSISDLNMLYLEATEFQSLLASNGTLGTVRVCVIKDNSTTAISASSIYNPMMMWGGGKIRL